MLCTTATVVRCCSRKGRRRPRWESTGIVITHVNIAQPTGLSHLLPLLPIVTTKNIYIYSSDQKFCTYWWEAAKSWIFIVFLSSRQAGLRGSNKQNFQLMQTWLFAQTTNAMQRLYDIGYVVQLNEHPVGSYRKLEPPARRWWVDAREQFTLCAAIVSPPAQHSLWKQPRGPRRKQAQISPAGYSWRSEMSTKPSVNGIERV